MAHYTRIDWTAVNAAASTISSTDDAGSSRWTGCDSPCRSGPTIRAPARRRARAQPILAASRPGKTSTLADPPTGLSGAFDAATSGDQGRVELELSVRDESGSGASQPFHRGADLLRRSMIRAAVGGEGEERHPRFGLAEPAEPIGRLQRDHLQLLGGRVGNQIAVREGDPPLARGSRAIEPDQPAGRNNPRIGPPENRSSGLLHIRPGVRQTGYEPVRLPVSNQSCREA